MGEGKTITELLAEMRQADLDRRAHKRQQHAPKFVSEEGQEVTVELPVVTQRRNPGAVNDLSRIGSDVRLTGSRPQRPDQIIQDDKKG